jgi:hypothetical protein
MKKIAIVIFSVLLFGIGLPAIGARHKHEKRHRHNGNITSVSVLHPGCYGRCPQYSIEINSDGMMTYTALRFNPDTGIFEKKISPEKAMELINQFTTYRVDTCQNIYKTRVPDISGLVITIQYNDSTKTIRDANFGPYFLKQLANSIDQLGIKDDSTWRKTGMPKNY